MKLHELQQAIKLTESRNPAGFDTTTTGMPHYDDMMELPEYFEKEKGYRFRKINMTPDEYIMRAAKGFGSSVAAITSSREPEKVEDYAQKMLGGERFPMLTLDYSRGSFTQEGIHRAMAAKKANLDIVPVLSVRTI